MDDLIKKKIDKLILSNKKPEATILLVKEHDLKLAEAFDFVENQEKNLRKRLKLYPAESNKLNGTEIDRLIFKGEILKGILSIKDAFDVELSQAMFLFFERYSTLLKNNAELFVQKDPKKYWDSFYS